MTKLEELIPRTSPVVLFCESQIVRTLQIGENEVGEWKSKSDQVGAPPPFLPPTTHASSLLRKRNSERKFSEGVEDCALSETSPPESNVQVLYGLEIRS